MMSNIDYYISEMKEITLRILNNSLNNEELLYLVDMLKHYNELIGNVIENMEHKDVC